MKTAQLQALKDKAIDVTSDVLSLPKRAYYGAKQKWSDASFSLRKKSNQFNALAKNMKGAPDKGNETDPLFRSRVMQRNRSFKN